MSPGSEVPVGKMSYPNPSVGEPVPEAEGRAALPAIGLALLLTALATPVLLFTKNTLQPRDIGIVYLVPVLASAVRWGLWPAIAAAILGAAASAFFLYAPFYSLSVADPQDVINLLLFILTAVIISQLASAVRAHAQAADRGRQELGFLYRFSRRLASAAGTSEIFSAIEEQLTAITGCRSFVVPRDAASGALSQGGRGRDIPTGVRAQLDHGARRKGIAGPERLVDPDTGRLWLVREIEGGTVGAVVLVELGESTGLPARQGVSDRVDSVVRDAIGTLSRLDVAKVIGEAQLRAEREALREALIGSVSHGLRTPLASILGSATIMAKAPAVAGDKNLAALAGIIVSEADRLNGDIQRLLDAAKVSQQGVMAHMTWVEPADLVAATLDRLSTALSGHDVSVTYGDGLPLVETDPSLMSQALTQIVENAVRYSPEGSAIRISVTKCDAEVVFAVEDEGIGLACEDGAKILEKFYRGARVRETTRGSGLGLWIANSFVSACNGRLTIASRRDGPGTRAELGLPAASEDRMKVLGNDGD